MDCKGLQSDCGAGGAFTKRLWSDCVGGGFLRRIDDVGEEEDEEEDVDESVGRIQSAGVSLQESVYSSKSPRVSWQEYVVRMCDWYGWLICLVGLASRRRPSARTVDVEEHVLHHIQDHEGVKYAVVYRKFKMNMRYPFSAQLAQELAIIDAYVLWTFKVTSTRDATINLGNAHAQADENHHATQSRKQLFGRKCAYSNEIPDLLEDVILVHRRVAWFKHESAPAHCSHTARTYMDATYLGQWIGSVSLLVSHLGERSSKPDRSLSDFRILESYRTMPLVSGFSRGSPVSPSFHSGAAPYLPQSPSLAIKSSLLRNSEHGIGGNGTEIFGRVMAVDSVDCFAHASLFLRSTIPSRRKMSQHIAIEVPTKFRNLCLTIVTYCYPLHLARAVNFRYEWSGAIGGLASITTPPPPTAEETDRRRKNILGIRTLGTTRELEKLLDDVLRLYTFLSGPAASSPCRGHLAEYGSEDKCGQRHDAGGRGVRGVNRREGVKSDDRIQRPGEPLQELWQDIVRLTHLSLEGFSEDGRDVIAVDFFVDAITDTDVRQALRLASPHSMQDALVRALKTTMKDIATRVIARKPSLCPPTSGILELWPNRSLENPVPPKELQDPAVRREYDRELVKKTGECGRGLFELRRGYDTYPSSAEAARMGCNPRLVIEETVKERLHEQLELTAAVTPIQNTGPSKPLETREVQFTDELAHMHLREKEDSQGPGDLHIPMSRGVKSDTQCGPRVVDDSFKEGRLVYQISKRVNDFSFKFCRRDSLKEKSRFVHIDRLAFYEDTDVGWSGATHLDPPLRDRRTHCIVDSFFWEGHEWLTAAKPGYRHSSSLPMLKKPTGDNIHGATYNLPTSGPLLRNQLNTKHIRTISGPCVAAVVHWLSAFGLPPNSVLSCVTGVTPSLVSKDLSNEVKASASMPSRHEMAPYQHVTITGPLNVATAWDDHHLDHMAVMDLTASSIQLARHWSTAMGMDQFESMVQHCLLRAGLVTCMTLCGIPLLRSTIGYNMRSRLLHIEGNINSNRYIRDVLEPDVLPLLQANPHTVFPQDNAWPHVARNVQAFSSERRVPLLSCLHIRLKCFPLNMSGIWLVGDLFVMGLH
ncbi:hypothetical protein PR048_011058 [Dryococelus australis]|uniref:Uncharacterized protein n=1 Tax=Dryococelus australis TaxID=614101 RepID=A0ABQ9HKK2_9NEOP|nr:hypothetical protein PR048_011058 [Dryococelus australis]